MAENESEKYEHDIAEKLKKLDAQIKVPEMPDAQAILEKANAPEKSNVKKFGWSKFSTVAAAVVILCIAIPLAIHNPFLKTVSEDAVMENNMGASDSIMTEEIYGGVENEDDEVVQSAENAAETPMMMAAMPAQVPAEAPKEAREGIQEEERKNENEIASARVKLSDYFDGTKTEGSAQKNSNHNYPSDSVSHFEDKLSKKRSIEVDVNDSVSVILYDTSGETEVLLEFWVEGTYVTSNFDGETYIIDMFFPIDKAEFESGDYLPLIGNREKGTYQLSEDDIAVEGDITEAIIFMTVKINVENGSYTIDAVLK